MAGSPNDQDTKGEQQASTIAERIEATLQDATSGENQSGSEGQGEGQAEARPLEGEFLVDFDGNGTQRRMKAEDIAKTIRDASSVKQTKSHLESMMQEAARTNTTVQILQNMPPEQRQRLEQFLSNPDAFVPANQAGKRSTEDDGDEDDTDQILDRLGISSGGEKKGQRQSDPLMEHPAIQQLIQGYNALLQRESAREQEHHQQTLGQQVDQAMKDWPVFRDTPGAGRLARDAIMAKLQLNPSEDVQGLVANTAAATRQAIAQAQEGVVERETSARPGDAPRLPKLDIPLSADSLANGGLYRELTKKLGE